MKIEISGLDEKDEQRVLNELQVIVRELGGEVVVGAKKKEKPKEE